MTFAAVIIFTNHNTISRMPSFTFGKDRCEISCSIILGGKSGGAHGHAHDHGEEKGGQLLFYQHNSFYFDVQWDAGRLATLRGV